mmetsp:Transcript_43764/g.81683  ORF Transcript_43764/g.81683 Transcript_43764/m.81683 type:complete len:142 (+) Transcript_43764:43-468(+)
MDKLGKKLGAALLGKLAQKPADKVRRNADSSGQFSIVVRASTVYVLLKWMRKFTVVVDLRTGQAESCEGHLIKAEGPWSRCYTSLNQVEAFFDNARDFVRTYAASGGAQEVARRTALWLRQTPSTPSLREHATIALCDLDA